MVVALCHKKLDAHSIGHDSTASLFSLYVDCTLPSHQDAAQSVWRCWHWWRWEGHAEK